MISFLYGAAKTYIDVTALALRNCVYGDLVYIRAGDTGDEIFPDPLPGIAKEILVVRGDVGSLTAEMYGPNEAIYISLTESEKSEAGLSRTNNGDPGKRVVLPPAGLSNDEKLRIIHAQLQFTGGDLRHEWVEQFNTLDYIGPEAKVLELGSAVGRNTLLISSILNDETNLVTLECNPATVEILRKNRSSNNFRFHIEPAALSYRRLMYNQDLELTVPGEELQDGYEWINTITFEEIVEKYAIEFDTLVADCEGALYYILQDNDRILENMQTVILESDYRIAGQKWAVEAVFKKYGLQKIKTWTLAAGDSSGIPQECIDSFWEVWKR